jgi:outer membrane protein W
MMMKKIPAITMTMILLAGLSFGQANRFQLSLFGGKTHVPAYGSDGDYVSGSNDFPSTPAHTPAFFGAAFAYSLTNRLGIELRAEYALATNLNLTDPSDQDSVTIPSAKHMSFSLNFHWALASGKFCPYLIAGGGVDKISTNSSSYATNYGYEVTFSAPARTLDYFLNAGAGLSWNIKSSLGFFVEARYRFLFVRPDSIQDVAGSGGIRLKF